ncbi:putative 37S ribosomal protein rsm22 [Rosellinia necatrix]|uniref:Putative 37S ribosomal protein rsm22 n=1 Tax=Rosellinia necatrix TaxID=77044 RepID=A0A1W2TGE7_ROSNE|nr:putative 37S ribosomal protein rsm22 [Rosellinia necatrix]
MSVEIWPPIAPDQLKIEEDATQARELEWLLNSLQTTLHSLRYGLAECYALLAPIDPGSTLVLSTPRAELVKGHVTRVGTRLVKGTIHTRLRTTAPLTVSINSAHPIHLAPLVALNTLLTQAVDLATLCFTEGERSSSSREQRGGGATSVAATAVFLSSQLRLLAQAIDEASAILKGTAPVPAPTPAQPLLPLVRDANASRPGTATTDVGDGGGGGGDWTQRSAASTSFAPPLSHALSFHVTIQDACLVLHLRALEPADAPVNLGVKLALAIGTARRLEHDEAERVFAYRHHEFEALAPAPAPASAQATAAPGRSQPYPTKGSRGGGLAGARNESTSAASAMGGGGDGDGGLTTKVYVREKVRVESADPSLLSMSTKLTALSNTLGLARRNLAAVMGEEVDF